MTVFPLIRIVNFTKLIEWRKLASDSHPDEKKGCGQNRNPSIYLVGHEGFEPSTS